MFQCVDDFQIKFTASYVHKIETQYQSSTFPKIITKKIANTERDFSFCCAGNEQWAGKLRVTPPHQFVKRPPQDGDSVRPTWRIRGLLIKNTSYLMPGCRQKRTYVVQYLYYQFE